MEEQKLIILLNQEVIRKTVDTKDNINKIIDNIKKSLPKGSTLVDEKLQEYYELFMSDDPAIRTAKYMLTNGDTLNIRVLKYKQYSAYGEINSDKSLTYD